MLLGPAAISPAERAGSSRVLQARAPPIEQLRSILTANFVKVINLFRDWDDNADGQIDREEFVGAMNYLGP